MDHAAILRTVKRMAWEIYEHHDSAGKLILAGVDDRGYVLANLLYSELKSIADVPVELLRIRFDRHHPESSAASFEPGAEMLKGHKVVLVDDVLNTGKTLVYCMKWLMDAGATGIRTAFLAERSHRNYPVQGDVVGISLATTLQEHVHFNAADPENLNLYLADV